MNCILKVIHLKVELKFGSAGLQAKFDGEYDLFLRKHTYIHTDINPTKETAVTFIVLYF